MLYIIIPWIGAVIAASLAVLSAYVGNGMVSPSTLLFTAATTSSQNWKLLLILTILPTLCDDSLYAEDAPLFTVVLFTVTVLATELYALISATCTFGFQGFTTIYVVTPLGNVNAGVLFKYIVPVAPSHAWDSVVSNPSSSGYVVICDMII